MGINIKEVKKYDKSIVNIISYYKNSDLINDIIEFLEGCGHRVVLDESTEESLLEETTRSVALAHNLSQKNENIEERNWNLQIGTCNSMFGDSLLQIKTLEEISQKKSIEPNLEKFKEAIAVFESIGVKIDFSIRYKSSEFFKSV